MAWPGERPAASNTSVLQLCTTDMFHTGCLPAAFRESIPMGETDLTAAQVQHLVQQMGHHYKGNKYHLLQLNCNHFASDMCMQLTGKPAPPWVSKHSSGVRSHWVDTASTLSQQALPGTYRILRQLLSCVAVCIK